MLVIDQQGGRDVGFRFENIFEKDIALEISLYQYNRFKELEIPVAITRNKDIYLESGERTNIVKDSKAKYCICNHINNGEKNGVEVIHSINSDGKLAHKIYTTLTSLGLSSGKVYSKSSDKNQKLDYHFMHRETGNCITNIITYGSIDNHEDRQKLLSNAQVYAEGVIKEFCKFLGLKYIDKEKINIEDIELQKSIEDLVGHGLIDNPTYWITNEEYNGESVRDIIKKFGAYINKLK